MGTFMAGDNQMDAQRPCRKKLRLEEYNYAQCCACFVTICTKERQALLGHV